MRVLILGLLSLVALGAGPANSVLQNQRLMRTNKVLLKALREISSETESRVGEAGGWGGEGPEYCVNGLCSEGGYCLDGICNWGGRAAESRVGEAGGWGGEGPEYCVNGLCSEGGYCLDGICNWGGRAAESKVGGSSDWSASKQYWQHEHVVYGGYLWTCENQVCEGYAPGSISDYYWKRGPAFSDSGSGSRGQPAKEQSVGCGADSTTWNAGWGQCGTYAVGGTNEAHCTTDWDKHKVWAKDACPCSCTRGAEKAVGEYKEVNCDSAMDSFCSVCTYWAVCSARVGGDTLWGRCLDDGTCTQNWGHHRVQYHP